LIYIKARRSAALHIGLIHMEADMFLSCERILRISALAAAATVIGMVAIFFATGVGQDPLQFVHSPSEYGALLLHNPDALRATIGLDNLFIVLYTTTFVSLGVVLARAGAPKVFVYLSIGLMLVIAFLDMIENFHFMTMLARAEQGILPSENEIGLQVWESLLKFHVGYLGLFLLGFAFPRRTRAERAMGYLNWFVQLPVGILIYVTPRMIAVPLVFVRFTYFVAGLVLMASVVRERRPAAPITAAANDAFETGVPG
jgi:hypothetical protein